VPTSQLRPSLIDSIVERIRSSILLGDLPGDNWSRGRSAISKKGAQFGSTLRVNSTAAKYASNVSLPIIPLS
jgi:hypothetical protein